VPSVITTDEILDALVTASTAPEDARTMAEIKQETGIGEKRLRRALVSIRDEGRLQVHHVVRRDLSGKPQKVPAYTIAPRKRAKR
jgi:DNA-binding transcriptional regulator PaaX